MRGITIENGECLHTEEIEIFRPVIFAHSFIDEFGLDVLLEQASIGGASHVVFTHPDFMIMDFSEPISVADENPTVTYARESFQIKICAPVEWDDGFLIKKDEDPHYRDLEYKHKKKRF